MEKIILSGSEIMISEIHYVFDTYVRKLNDDYLYHMNPKC